MEIIINKTRIKATDEIRDRFIKAYVRFLKEKKIYYYVKKSHMICRKKYPGRCGISIFKSFKKTNPLYFFDSLFCTKQWSWDDSTIPRTVLRKINDEWFNFICKMGVDKYDFN